MLNTIDKKSEFLPVSEIEKRVKASIFLATSNRTNALMGKVSWHLEEGGTYSMMHKPIMKSPCLRISRIDAP
jgi:hypothetical protein